MMMTCWIGVVGDLADAAATVSVQSALVARQSDLNSESRIMKISPVEFCEVSAAGSRTLPRSGTDRAAAPASIRGHNFRLMSNRTQFCERRSVQLFGGRRLPGTCWRIKSVSQFENMTTNIFWGGC